LTQESEEKLEEFFRAFAGARKALLLLDYDGTLAPFRVDRFKARPWTGVRELLARIQNQAQTGLETRMAIISGRPAAEIAPLLGLDSPLEIWGLHGAERLYPDGRRELQEAPPATRSRLDELREQLRRDSFDGLFEDKPNAAVMHWRGTSPRKARQIEQRTRELFEPLAQLEGLTLLEFESGLELRVGRGKGEAVEAILKETNGDGFAACPVAFLGDDVTDEAAFCAVNSAKGPHLSALVRRKWRETAADVWLKPPVELRQLLQRWIDATAGRTN
jgi:trehalose 6-phosphate phosphatase